MKLQFRWQVFLFPWTAHHTQPLFNWSCLVVPQFWEANSPNTFAKLSWFAQVFSKYIIIEQWQVIAIIFACFIKTGWLSTWLVQSNVLNKQRRVVSQSQIPLFLHITCLLIYIAMDCSPPCLWPSHHWYNFDERIYFLIVDSSHSISVSHASNWHSSPNPILTTTVTSHRWTQMKSE